MGTVRLSGVVRVDFVAHIFARSVGSAWKERIFWFRIPILGGIAFEEVQTRISLRGYFVCLCVTEIDSGTLVCRGLSVFLFIEGGEKFQFKGVELNPLARLSAQLAVDGFTRQLPA